MDRNTACRICRQHVIGSLSARRAWIEISKIIMLVLGLEKVALRKESVDRNLLMWYQCNTVVKSLSARRAWIEISASGRRGTNAGCVALRKESVDRNYPPGPPSYLFGAVALRKESVDRNLAWHCMSEDVSYSRSPQGERG